jgi:sugar lactone lactonase YvrE
MMNMPPVELVLDARAMLGEGSIWDPDQRVLYWVDILGQRLHRFDPVTRVDKAWDIGQFVSTVVPRESGGVLLAVYHGLAGFDLATGRLDFIADPEADLPDTRFNDGKCDPAGRFWAGTMSLTGASEAGSLYCLNAQHQVRKMVDKVTTSNGIVWSLDQRTMYYIDTRRQQVDAFDYDVTSGNIDHRRVAVPIPADQGRPDGMTLDAEGMIWVAHWEGWRVTRWNPVTGQLLATIHLPVARVTSCAFGGVNLDDLYITTARPAADDPAQSHAGGLYRVRPGVRGVPAVAYKG